MKIISLLKPLEKFFKVILQSTPFSRYQALYRSTLKTNISSGYRRRDLDSL